MDVTGEGHESMDVGQNALVIPLKEQLLQLYKTYMCKLSEG